MSSPRACARSFAGAPPRRAVLAQGDVELNPATREVRLRGEPLPLSPREFALLEALLTARGDPVARTARV